MKILAISPYSGYYSGVFEFLESEFDKNPDTEYERINAPNYYIYGKSKKLETKRQTLFILLCNCLYFFYHLVKRSFVSYDVVILASHQVAIPYLALVKIFPFLSPKKKILVFSFFLHSMGSSNKVQGILEFILKNSKIHMIVQSAPEIDYYAKLSSQMKITMFPYCAAEPSIECVPPEMVDYVFSGGVTNRDYDCFIRAVRDLPVQAVIIAAESNVITEQADNVKILYNQTPEVFFGYLKNAKFVVIPLKEKTGASGQMVALRAMCYSKAVIYAQDESISQYFEGGSSGLSYPLGDDGILRSKIKSLLQNPDRSEVLGKTAFQRYLRMFHISHFFSHIQEQILIS